MYVELKFLLANKENKRTPQKLNKLYFNVNQK